jgi:long-subunit acyl-CoA synthetase (AMP-forming)
VVITLPALSNNSPDWMVVQLSFFAAAMVEKPATTKQSTASTTHNFLMESSPL